MPGEGRVKGSSAISGKEVTVTKTDERLGNSPGLSLFSAGN